MTEFRKNILISTLVPLIVAVPFTLLIIGITNKPKPATVEQPKCYMTTYNFEKGGSGSFTSTVTGGITEKIILAWKAEAEKETKHKAALTGFYEISCK